MEELERRFDEIWERELQKELTAFRDRNSGKNPSRRMALNLKQKAMLKSFFIMMLEIKKK